MESGEVEQPAKTGFGAMVPRAIALTIRANFSKSACFDESSGLRSKNGITRSSKCVALSHDEHECSICLLFGLM